MATTPEGIPVEDTQHSAMKPLPQELHHLYFKDGGLTPDEFVTVIEDRLSRRLDAESRRFFLDHPRTVEILDDILSAKLNQSTDHKQDNAIINTLVAQMASKIPPESLGPTGTTYEVHQYLALFQKSCPDAALLIEKALVAFYELYKYPPPPGDDAIGKN
jgi:hypothetical protein